MTKFKNLSVGSEFDFDGGKYPTFFDRCRKVSSRCYVSLDNDKLGRMQVGTVSVEVYHVSELVGEQA